MKKLQIAEKVTTWLQLPEYGYTALEYELSAPGAGRGWGIRCRIPASGEEAFVPDVTSDAEKAALLFRMIVRGGVTPVTLYDVLYDMIA